MLYTTRLQPVRVDGSTSRNVIAEKSGSGATRQVVIVTAHLDSINLPGWAGGERPRSRRQCQWQRRCAGDGARFQHHQGEA